MNSNTVPDTHSEPFISDYERRNYWNGISNDPPHLLYRSDLESNPFPHPSPGERWPYIPVKSVHGVFNTPLNPVWDTVAPLIIQHLRNANMALTSLLPARFRTQWQEDGEEILGPIVIWIALRPGKNTASQARDASQEILNILSNHGVEDAAVEWYEGEVKRL